MDGGEKKEVRRPMNAFLIFCKRHRGFVREKNPDMDNRSVTRVLGDLWANLGDEKKIYTNLAKQYKDAFMKANPNYKWHSADKSQSSSGKMVSKPTNSRVIRNVAEIHSDGSIIPGKLADPEKMGGLNLLLMADKETCEDRSSSLSLPSGASFSLTRSAPASFSVRSTQTTTTTAEQSTVSNSALLQLAEMCTSELQSSSEDRQLLNSHTLLLAGRPSSIVSRNSIFGCHKAMPPPKKRARHWSLTEADSVYDASNYNSNKEYTFGSLPSQKIRCTSLGSTLWSDDKYSSLEKCKPVPPRRKLSSSATESIPSPSGPFAEVTEDADSPVFSPDTSKSDNSFSGESKFESNESFIRMQGNFSHSSFNNPAFCFEMPVQPNSASASLQLQQPPSVLVAGVSKSVPCLERKESPASNHQLSHASQHDVLASLYAAPSSEIYGSREMDSRSEKNSNPDFYIWREPGRTKIKAAELSLVCLNPQESAHSLAKSSLSPVLKLKNSDGKQVEYDALQHNLARSELSDDSTPVTEPFTLSADLKTASSACALPCAKTSFTSIIAESRIASILSNPDTVVPNLRFNCSNDTHDALSKTENEPESSTLKTPFISQTHTFSKGKLKKKWTERMLIEARLQKDEGLEAGESFTSDPFNIENSSHKNINANQKMPIMELKPAIFKEEKFIKKTAAIPRYSEVGDLKRSTACENVGHGYQQAELILNHPHSSLDSTTSQSGNIKCFSTTSHAKVTLQMSPNKQAVKPDHIKSSSDELGIKLDQDICDLTKHHLEQKPFHVDQLHLHGSISRRKVDSVCNNRATKAEDLSNKQVLNKIAACGKEFMDRIVETLCKTNFSVDKPHIETGISGNCAGDGFSLSKNLLTEIKTEPGEMELKKECTVVWIKKDEKRDCSVATATSTAGKGVSKVYSLSPREDESNSHRKADQTAKDVNGSCSENRQCASVNSESLSGQTVTEDCSRKWENCRQKTTSPSNEPCCQTQWSAVGPESCDQSDVNEDTGVQPVRKSRRANRGQKYQELIKEGFIQPSRERLANRNIERHGRSFGSREEFEKMEMKRTLKRSASERDAPSDSQAISSSNVSAASDGSMEKRFTSGDFDLEKEIESLPVCSLDQLEKKKVMRRRCDSDTLGSPPCHKSDGDASSLSRTSSGNSQTKVHPLGCLLSKFEGKLSEPSCPAPHIPLPKEEKLVEPVTGSRKRKARRHCITRISVVDEKTATTEIAAQKAIKFLPSPFAPKKLCSASGDIPCSSVGAEESARNLSSVLVTAHTNPEDDKLVRSTDDSRIDGVEMRTVPEISLIGNMSGEKSTDDMPLSNIDTLSLVGVGDDYSSQPSSALSQMLSFQTAVPSKRHYESLPSSPDSKTHRKNKLSVSSSLPSQHVPTLKKVSVTAIPKLSGTNDILETSGTNLKRKSSILKAKKHPAVPVTETIFSAIKSISSDSSFPISSKILKHEDMHKQLVTLSTYCQEIKTLSTPVLFEKDLPKKKCLERKSKKIAGAKIKLDCSQVDEKLPAAVKKAQGSLRRKFAETRMFSTNSNTPLVSALLGHRDLSCAVKLPENGEKGTFFPHPSLGHDKSSTQPSETENSATFEMIKISCDSAKTTRADLSSPVLSADSSQAFAFKSQFIPLVGQCQDIALSSDVANKNVITSLVPPLSDSALRSVTKAIAPTSESIPLSERLTLATTAEVKPSFPYKPLLSESVSGILAASSSVSETDTIKPLQSIPTEGAFVLVSGAVPQLSPQIATASVVMTSDHYSCRTSTSMPCTSATLHNSLLNIMPASTLSSSLSSLMICTNTSTSSAPLLSLTPPLSSPSTSSAMLSPTVISLATSTPSTKSDIVSYTVIGSSSIMEAGSPHMIGSPHLPESPSVAIVQS